MSAAHLPLDDTLPKTTAANPDVATSDPVRRGLVAYAETIAERDRLKRELEDSQLRLAQSETRVAGLEHELKRAEIHRDEARVERDAAVREAAKYETFFEAQAAMMREFSPKPADKFTAAEQDILRAQGDQVVNINRINPALQTGGQDAARVAAE